MPDVAFEVRPPSNTWTELFTKVGEYLTAGVRCVVIVDDDTRTVSVYRPDTVQQTLHPGDTLTLPAVLPGFELPVARLFS